MKLNKETYKAIYFQMKCKMQKENDWPQGINRLKAPNKSTDLSVFSIQRYSAKEILL